MRAFIAGVEGSPCLPASARRVIVTEMAGSDKDAILVCLEKILRLLVRIARVIDRRHAMACRKLDRFRAASMRRDHALV
jgi:hypothetical protein